MDEPEVIESVNSFEYRAMAKPWSRFWSRMLDIWIWSWPVGIGFAALFPTQTKAILAYGENGPLFGLLLMPLVMVVDALCLALFGNTPGRAIIGIRVETIRHERLSVPTALYRNAFAYWSGLGLAFPIATVFTLGLSYNEIKAARQTPWDKELYTRVYDVSSGPVRTFICAVLVVAAAAVKSIIGNMS